MKIAYIMSRFPLISETFILREMIEVERQGHEIMLYPLICQNQPVIHDDANNWMSRAQCSPFISLPILTENIRRFAQTPLMYISILAQILWHNRSSLDFMIKGVSLFPKAVYLARRMKDLGIDHIHAHYASHPALEAWIINKLTGISYSITIHSHDIYDCHSMLGPKLKNATFLAPISEYNIKYLENLLGDWVRTKCRVIHCGINPDRYMPSSPKGKDDILKIIQIGSLHWKKGQTYLIQAMAILRDRGIPFHLRIIGEGEERVNIEKVISNYKLTSQVEMLGAKTQDEVAKLLGTADCYIQSSISEGIPVAIMEAMACELPVISTNITGIPELVLDGETGILVEPKDVSAMASALETLYKKTPEQRLEMGKKGREWVLKEFTLEGNVRKLVACFESITSNY